MRQGLSPEHREGHGIIGAEIVRMVGRADATGQAAELLGVSEMTVRRDIAEHPDRFAYFGGHIMSPVQIEGNTRYEIATAADSHAAAKRDACIHAARHIRPDETIFLDCGTPLARLVELIPDYFQLTVICYALNVAEKLARKQRGATCAAFHEARVKQKVISLARESYLVIDSSKIGQLQRAFFAPMNAFKAIITEHGEAPIGEGR